MTRRPPCPWQLRPRSTDSPAQNVEGLVLVIVAVLWLWAGLATWNDLIGHPRDAPFLRIPGHFRSLVFWWTPAALSLIAGYTGKVRPWAWTALAVGPAVRFFSYLTSWVVSWPALDRWIPDDTLKGDPRAWGSQWIYAGYLVGLAAFAVFCRKLKAYERRQLRLIADKAQLEQRIAQLTTDLGKG